MAIDEIMAVLETLNEIDLNQVRQTRAICYHTISTVGFADANGHKLEVSINKFWPLPGDIEETAALHSPEHLKASEELANKMAEYYSKKN